MELWLVEDDANPAQPQGRIQSFIQHNFNFTDRVGPLNSNHRCVNAFNERKSLASVSNSERR